MVELRRATYLAMVYEGRCRVRALAVVSVYTMVTFVDEDYWSVRPIGFMRHQRSGHGRCIAPSSTSLRITKDKDRRTIEQREKWLCLKDVMRTSAADLASQGSDVRSLSFLQSAGLLAISFSRFGAAPPL